MRKELKNINGERKKFTATIARFGKKNNYRGNPSETVLLTNVRDDKGQLVTDHIWLVIGKRMECVFKNEGKRISFEARVTLYTKGFKGKGLELLKPVETDYKLSNPTNITILKD